MEKISLPQLIVELKDNSALYNQWYNENEMKYGNLPSQNITSWMVEVVEPIVAAFVAVNSAPEKIHEVVKALYIESLKLIGSGQAIRYKDEYKSAWLLMVHMPNLVQRFPIKIISLLNEVLLNIHTYASEKSIDWCDLMQKTCSEIKTIEDFKIVGRICAWKCGLAHLRSRLESDFDELSEDLQQIITVAIGFDKNSNQIFETIWPNKSVNFQGVQGGFIGMDGFFENPPMLAKIEEHVFVTDSKSSYALFADQYGKVLIPAHTVDSTYILSNSERLKNLEKWLIKNNIEIDSEIITSSVKTKDTLFYTLQNSYFIYLFSIANV
ncbi:hypothetical protein [Flavobacterium frigoris]|uniref:Uncharacterized protein n=1 Tax=Flavobacterium frigoris TaxID=229204 RepID=A0A1H9KYL5_FLAFI|nr:hypothetical protein [Flavobacterium frigoris]SER04089.1 hypothetical protein SAMN05444355_106134 [Flavobacterium frigoris]